MNRSHICFVALSASLFAFGAQAQDTSRAERMRAELDQRFAAADKNGDGRLSADEAKQGMPFVHRQFAKIDSAGEGSVSKAQIAAYVQAMAAERGKSRP
ncbi:MAG: calcium-binding protein [Hydrogenophaga sp.]|uniref:calcium-binding protein n=1 Tax=Hydrogenophaga sp. TaxID=1904254 RepID=UPI001D7B19AF|nr:calcium-binding protein [Hydrogenophaga sp.]MBX3608362.1 calcium-binding protein [Hydrogenophaga sp.]